MRRRAGETCGHRDRGRPNGPEVNPRGQGLRGYGSAAHGLPACESRDAGRAPPCSFRTFRAGSAGGPKPGRAGFYLELGRRFSKKGLHLTTKML
jgi:hypothetical protein